MRHTQPSMIKFGSVENTSDLTETGQHDYLVCVLHGRGRLVLTDGEGSLWSQRLCTQRGQHVMTDIAGRKNRNPLSIVPISHH